MVTGPFVRLGAKAADLLLAALIAAVVILLLTEAGAAGPGQPGPKPQAQPAGTAERLFAPARLSEIGRPSLLFRAAPACCSAPTRPTGLPSRRR